MTFSDSEKSIIEQLVNLHEKGHLSVLGNILEERLRHEHGFYINVKTVDSVGIFIKESYMKELSKKYAVYGVKYLIEGLQKEADLIDIVYLDEKYKAKEAKKDK